MKRFEIIDCWISVILILGSIVYGLMSLDGNFLIGYFVVGGWQVISMLIHFFNQWFCERGSKRSNYHWAVLVIILLSAAGFAFYSVLMMLFFLLLFAAPPMAIFYTWLCYNEIYVKMQRPLSILK